MEFRWIYPRGKGEAVSKTRMGYDSRRFVSVDDVQKRLDAILEDPDFDQHMECDKARDMIIYLVRELREEPSHEE